MGDSNEWSLILEDYGKLILQTQSALQSNVGQR